MTSFLDNSAFLLFASFLGSVVGCWILVRWVKTITPRQRLKLDEVQDSFASAEVSRLGGVPVYLSGLLAVAVAASMDLAVGHSGLIVFLSAVPVVVAGFIEDYWVPVRPRWRILAGCLSAGLALSIAGWGIFRVDVIWLDQLLQSYGWVVLALTLFAVSGLTNAFNLIDGLHGLSVGVGLVVLLGLVVVSVQVGDAVVFGLSAIGMATLLGFFVFNYPRGLIFLGDCGAYWIGFMIAELSILLVLNQPRVSPWFPLVIALYPITETLFTIARRLLRRRQLSAPDCDHLHQLLHALLEPVAPGMVPRYSPWASPYLWFLASISVLSGVLFWDNTGALQASALFYVALYVFLYALLLRVSRRGHAHEKA